MTDVGGYEFLEVERRGPVGWLVFDRPEAGNAMNGGMMAELERAWLDELFGPAGYIDVVRALHPDADHGPYSWWSYRGKAFDNDAGWRIDYHAATAGLAATAVAVRLPPKTSAISPR